MKGVSDNLIKKAKKNGVEWDVYVMALLVAVGMSERDAYYAVINKNSQSTEDYDMGQLRRILADNAYCYLVTDLQKQYKKITKRNQQEIAEQESIPISDGLMSKEEVARELLKTANSMKPGSKERAEVMMKYADLLQMKKDVVEDEEKLVHFYLPLSCRYCELYIKKEKEQIRNTEEDD
jgi:hypothetical protein